MDFFWHEMLEISLLLFIKHQLNTADISNHQATTYFSPPIPPQILDKDLFKYRHTLFSPLYKTLWNKGKELCTSCCECCPRLWSQGPPEAAFIVQVLKDSCSWTVSSQSKSTTNKGGQNKDSGGQITVQVQGKVRIRIYLTRKLNSGLAALILYKLYEGTCKIFFFFLQWLTSHSKLRQQNKYIKAVSHNTCSTGLQRPNLRTYNQNFLLQVIHYSVWLRELLPCIRYQS